MGLGFNRKTLTVGREVLLSEPYAESLIKLCLASRTKSLPRGALGIPVLKRQQELTKQGSVRLPAKGPRYLHSSMYLGSKAPKGAPIDIAEHVYLLCRYWDPLGYEIAESTCFCNESMHGKVYQQ